MIEEYLKRLENKIMPNYYSKSNFKEKIKQEFEDPAEVEEKKKKITIASSELLNKIQNEEDKKLIEEYLTKMNIKDVLDEGKNISSENKIKIYQKILENESVMENGVNANNNNINNSTMENAMRMTSSRVNKTYSLSPSRRLRMGNANEDEIGLKEKVHMLNIKNMNYRYEIETLRKNIDELNRKIEDQRLEIERLEKQKESGNRYLIKLESLLAGNSNDSKINFSFTSPKSNSSSKVQSSKIINFTNTSKNDLHLVDFNKTNQLIIEDRVNQTQLNISDRNDLREFLSTILLENQKLKAFQNQVFEISKNYDDINENMIEGMKQVHNLLSGENKLTSELDEGKEITNKFHNIIQNVEKTLETKQSEFNFILESKDQEIKFLRDEILKLNENVEQVKRDRIRDQKIINDYETEISFLSSRVQESQIKQNESSVREKENNLGSKFEKKIAPVKNTVNKIVKKFERTFDLQDKNNVKMISNIAKNIK